MNDSAPEHISTSCHSNQKSALVRACSSLIQHIYIKRVRADRHLGRGQKVYIDSTAVQNSGESIDISSRPDVTSN